MYIHLYLSYLLIYGDYRIHVGPSNPPKKRHILPLRDVCGGRGSALAAACELVAHGKSGISHHGVT